LPKKVRHIEDGTKVCSLADFGCFIDTSCDNLKEHYSSEIHQSCLAKAIHSYVQQLHMEPKDNLTLSNNEENYSDILESVDILAEGVSCLHDDNIQMHKNNVQLHSAILEQQKQLTQLKSSVEESAQLTHSIQMNSTVLETEIETLKQMINDLMSQSANDGTFMWKITDVSKKISDAAAERQTSVYSPPFFSSPTGYKMCMRLYFNGDGHARRTHLSLFFVLMRSDYDAVLQWPFSHKITFCLFDQTSNQRHIIDSFRPDIKSNSFQRPRSSMNIASGIPKFCPLPVIQQDNNPYVRDDCMFIRCIVDFASTPKTMLSYICSINPGLPTSVQREMIQSEMDRRKSIPSEDSSPKNDDSK
jgi:hypothetical protein